MRKEFSQYEHERVNRHTSSNRSYDNNSAGFKFVRYSIHKCTAKYAKERSISFWFKAILVLLLFLLCAITLQAQRVTEKTNLAMWATLSPNIGMEISISRRISLDATVSYHPWKFFKTFNMWHWLASPELRWWYCRRYEGSFWGIHAVGGQFNVRALPLTGLSKDYEYTGYLIGAGLSYGYQILLSTRWNMEFTAGFGFAMIDYDKYECNTCREKVAEGRYNYIGPTRLGISLVYFFR